MPQTIQVGTILIEDRPSLVQLLAIETEPYAANWRMVEGVERSVLDRKIHAAGWNFFFLEGEVRSLFLGEPHAAKIRNAVKRMLVKVREQNFNCLEVTGIASRRFAGVPYTIVSGHRRQIRQPWHLNQAEHNWAGQEYGT